MSAIEIRIRPDTVIRSWRDSDVASLARHANASQIASQMRDAFPYPYTEDDARSFLAVAKGRDPESFFAIAIDAAPVGGIGYTLHSDIERVAAEVGYWLGVAFWKRGIMTAVIDRFTHFVFDRHRELRRLYAVPLATNTASARVLEKAGYVLEGRMRQSAIKHGVVSDQLLYAITRDAVVSNTVDARR